MDIVSAHRWRLAWGSLVFFASCAILINGLGLLWLATYMSTLANASLASIMWLTILLKNPFTLQYARASLPEELWHDRSVFKICQFVVSVWGGLLLASTAISIFKFTHRDRLPEWVYTNISVGFMISGITFTTIYRHIKRKERAQRDHIGVAQSRGWTLVIRGRRAAPFAIGEPHGVNRETGC